MVRRNRTSNSLGKTKIDNWRLCGSKRKSETSYHGRMLRMRRKDYWLKEKLTETPHKNVTTIEIRKMIKK